MQLVILYSILCIIIFLVSVFLFKCKASFCYILSVWTFSSIFSVIFYIESQKYNNITLMPYIFFVLCLAISCIPFNCFNDKTTVIEIKNKMIFEKVITFFCIISILPFIENFIHILNTYNFDNSSQLADIYAEKMSGDLDKTKVINWYSPIGKICNSINLKFQYCSMFLLFLYISTRNINKYKLTALIIGCINPVLYTLSLSGRSAVVFTSLNAVLSFFLLRNYIQDRETLKNIKVLSLIIFSSFILLFAIMTIARYSTNEGAQSVSILGWISLYAGEGTLNFNEYMWHTKAYTEGDNCFAFFKDAIGLDTFVDLFKRRNYWGAKTGISPSIFYTFIGDIFSDFGFLTIPFILTISFILIRRIYRKRIVSSNHLYWLYVWGMLCITGFTCYTYKVYSASLDLLCGLIILYLINSPLGINSRKNRIPLYPYNDRKRN